MQPAELFALYPEFDGMRVNIVLSLQGSLTGPDGKSASLSNPLDRELLKRLRALSDVIVMGSKTFVAEQIRASRLAPIAVLTKTPSSDLAEAVNEAQRPDAKSLSLLPCGSALAATTQLHALGFRKILLEGGGETIRGFAAASLIDEFCITAPTASTAWDYLGSLYPAERIALIHEAQIDGVWYLRFKILATG